MLVKITPLGQIRMVYSDLLEVRDLGVSSIVRAGLVEPTLSSEWEVVVGGESHGRFSLREQAVRKEVEVVEGQL